MSPPCPEGCTCRRHTRLRPKCEPGCTCGRHRQSAESRQQRAEKLRGRIHTPEHNARVSAALKGRKLDPDHVAKMQTHGRSRDPNYQRWQAMMARCYQAGHPSFEFYGARGIVVHEAWHDPATFCDWIASNLGPCPPGYSIDRVDNDRGYEPGNLRWATRSEQTANRRRIARLQHHCAVCGSLFAATRRDARYCSTRCHSAAQRIRARNK